MRRDLVLSFSRLRMRSALLPLYNQKLVQMPSLLGSFRKMLVLSIIACMPKCPVRVGRPSYCNSLARTTEVKADSIAPTYGF